MIVGNELLMRILRSAEVPGQETGKMSIVIKRPYAFLEKDFRNVFQDHEDSRIIVDRRYGERRSGKKPAKSERRRADRRQSKQILAEACISI